MNNMLQADQTSTLGECRQLMTKRMRTSLTAVLNEVDEKLLEMAQNRSAGMDESACYDAVREIRIKRIEIKLRFERRLINLFEIAVRKPKTTENLASSGIDKTQNQFLFNDPDMQNSVSIKKSINEVRKNCAQVLLDLDKKFSLLLDETRTINPLQPEIVFEAFREACCDIKSGDEVRLIMFNIFEKRITGELINVYQDINRLLGDKHKHANNIAEEIAVDSVDLSEHEKQTTMLRYEIITLIEKRLDRKEVPDFVRFFLLKHWRVFLELTYEKYSENSIAWNAARQTMDDLIQSVRIMSTLYDRQRRVQLLPGLLFRLLNGMKIISMNDTDIEKFMKQLKISQLDSIDAGNKHLFDNLTEEIINNISKYECHN